MFYLFVPHIRFDDRCDDYVNNKICDLPKSMNVFFETFM